MQFRIQGQRVQCIRSIYDADIKRCKQKLIASFPKWSAKIPSDELEGLTDEEHQELSVWWASRKDSQASDMRASTVRYASSQLANLSAAISSDEAAGIMTEELAAKIWVEIGSLGKALRNSGYPRKPKKVAKKAGNIDGQGDLLS